MAFGLTGGHPAAAETGQAEGHAEDVERDALYGHRRLLSDRPVRPPRPRRLAAPASDAQTRDPHRATDQADVLDIESLRDAVPRRNATLGPACRSALRRRTKYAFPTQQA
jgi:hypothetical protein